MHLQRKIEKQTIKLNNQPGKKKREFESTLNNIGLTFYLFFFLLLLQQKLQKPHCRQVPWWIDNFGWCFKKLRLKRAPPYIFVPDVQWQKKTTHKMWLVLVPFLHHRYLDPFCVKKMYQIALVHFVRSIDRIIFLFNKHDSTENRFCN